MAVEDKPKNLRPTVEVAPLLGVHVNTLRRLARTGRLPGYMVGGHWKFDTDEVLAAAHNLNGGKP